MSRSRKIIFLDRDGVINKDPGGWTRYNYVTDWGEFVFLPGALDALRELTKAGYDIIIISNQGGISKGYFTEHQLNKVNERMVQEIKKYGGSIRKIYYCIHHDKDNCNCRKPKTGLFEKAAKELKLKFEGNYFIGDGLTDIDAGKRIGLKTILLLCGKTNLDMLNNFSMRPDYIFMDLKEAVDFVLKEGV